MSEPCRWCGEKHGVRCYAVAAIEYHPDGTVRRVEFVQPRPISELIGCFELSQRHPVGTPYPYGAASMGLGIVDPNLNPSNGVS